MDLSFSRLTCCKNSTQNTPSASSNVVNIDNPIGICLKRVQSFNHSKLILVILRLIKLKNLVSFRLKIIRIRLKGILQVILQIQSLQLPLRSLFKTILKHKGNKLDIAFQILVKKFLTFRKIQTKSYILKFQTSWNYFTNRLRKNRKSFLIQQERLWSKWNKTNAFRNPSIYHPLHYFINLLHGFKAVSIQFPN